MRNVKRIISLFLMIAILSSMNIAAFAVERSFAYDSEARILNKLGILLGSSNDLELGNKLTRLQGVVLSIRLRGKENAAKAMTAEQVEAVLATVEDAIPDWGKHYAAYALANGITYGVGGATEDMIRFAPYDDLSSQQFLTMVLRSMDYSGDDLFATAFVIASNIGMITVAEAIYFGTRTRFDRDAAAGIMYGALYTTVATGEQSLLQKLIADGAIDAAQAAEVMEIP